MSAPAPLSPEWWAAMTTEHITREVAKIREQRIYLSRQERDSALLSMVRGWLGGLAKPEHGDAVLAAATRALLVTVDAPGGGS